MARIASLILVALVASLAAQEAPKDAPKQNLEPLSKIIRDIVVKEAPKSVEDLSGWGKTTPIPPKLRLPNLPRTTIKVGDHVELAHGSWHKIKATIVDPEKDLTVRVNELKPTEKSQYRIALTGTAALVIDGEFQQWLNGLLIVGITGQATALVQVDVDADVKLSLDASKFPPAVKVEPKVVRCDVDLKKFELFRPENARNPQRAEGLNNDLRNLLQQAIRTQEPKIIEEANRTIAEALQRGKGTFSASALYQALSSGKASK
jgi:hypothetical protein